MSLEGIKTKTVVDLESLESIELTSSVNADKQDSSTSGTIEKQIKYKDISACFEDVDNLDKKKCRLCSLKINKKPFSLKRHLSRTHASIFKEISSCHKEEKSSSLLTYFKDSSDNRQKRKISTNTKATLNKALTEWVGADLVSFRSIESPAFRKFVKLLNDDYELPTRKTLANTHIATLYNEMREKIKINLLKSTSYNVTFDLWTCTKNQSQYLALTAHFVDDSWKLRSYCIGCLPCSESHTGDNIAALIEECISKLSLKLPFVAVTDNGTNVIKACQTMNLQILACLAHSINLCLDPILFPKSHQGLSAISKTIEKARAIATLFKRSPKTWNDYKLIYKTETNTEKDPNKIPRDCRTRWNSSLPMIKEVVNQQEQLEIAALKLKNPLLAITHNEKEILKSLQDLLEPFKSASTTLGGSKYPTSSLVFPIVYSINSQLNSIEVIEEMKLIKDQLQNEVNQRLLPFTRNVTCLIATYLDPRFKKKIFSENDKDLIIEKIGNFIESKLDHDQNPGKKSRKEGSKSLNANTFSSASMLENLLAGNDSDCDSEPSVDSSLFSELELFKKINIKGIGLKSIDTNPLEYWKTNENLFQNLSKVAKVYLAIPATSVESERLFSKAGDLITDRRTRLNSASVEKLIFINRNLEPLGYSGKFI